MNRLVDRHIIVTGAASGMGRAVARLFREEGARLALFDVNADAIAEVASGLSCPAFPVDVSKAEAVNRAVSQAEAALGRIDGLVNAAGILRAASILDTTPEVWRQIHDVNLFGPYLICRAALPALERAKGGTIVNIASMGGIRTPPLMAAYAASKAGLIAFTEGLALEHAPLIRANSVCPGIIKTAMTDELWAKDAHEGMDLVRRKVGLERKGTALEVAQVCLFLTSQESSFVTGSVYTVDGGPSRAAY